VKMRERLPLTEVSALLNKVVEHICEVLQPDPSQIVKIAEFMETLSVGQRINNLTDHGELALQTTPNQHINDLVKYTRNGIIPNGHTPEEVITKREITAATFARKRQYADAVKQAIKNANTTVEQNKVLADAAHDIERATDAG